MANNKYKDFKALNEGLTQNLKRVVNDFYRKGGLDEAGTNATIEIKKRTTLGYGVDKNGGNKKKLKPLSPPYKKYRAQAKKVGMLSPRTSPARSNLTLTGEMITDLGYQQKGEKITVSPKKDFLKDRAKWNAEKGRKFLHLSRNEIERIQKGVASFIEKAIKKYL